MTDGQPTFHGSEEEQKIARLLFELMVTQGQAFAANALIRRSLPDLVAHFVQQKVRPNAASMTELLEAAVRQNSHVFHREEADGQVSYLTTKLGRYVPPPPSVQPRRRPLGVTPARLPAVTTAPVKPALKPTIVQRETIPIVEARPPKRIPREIKPKAIHRHPQIVTPEAVIDLTEEAAQIYEKHGGMFQTALRERLAADARFISFGPAWYLADGLLSFSKMELRQVHNFLLESGVPESDARLVKEVFGRSEEDADYPLLRFCLNHELLREKRDFEFVGTAEDYLWRPAGRPTARTGLLKPGEVGQDTRYLEDEPPAAALEDGAWVHNLTFYEIENGLLPYDPWAKLLLPRPLLKEQKGVWLEFAAPQLEGLALFAELHYPSGNRGGWIDGLEELLVNFVAGARLVIRRGERSNAFIVEYPLAEEPQELSLLRYDERRQRFVFETLPIVFVVDETQILEKTRYKGFNNARRLEENSRRKSPAVLAYAFERVGQKSSEGEKTIYRASLDDLLPAVNVEKPFSKASLVKFMSTNPLYRKDESAEGYYFYTPLAGEKS
jgi:hypothetical protein